MSVGEKEVRHRAERRNEPLGDRLANLGSRFVAISRSAVTGAGWPGSTGADTLRLRARFGLTQRGFDVSS